jgi:hypothetical protein
MRDGSRKDSLIMSVGAMVGGCRREIPLARQVSRAIETALN